MPNTPFSPNYYRSAAVIGPRDSTPRRASPAPAYRRTGSGATGVAIGVQNLRTPPRQLKLDDGVVTPKRATTPLRHCPPTTLPFTLSGESRFVIPRRADAEESVCSSNDLSLADTASSNSNSLRRQVVTPTKALGQAFSLMPQSFAAPTISSSNQVRRAFSPTVSRRWEQVPPPTAAVSTQQQRPSTPRSTHRSAENIDDIKVVARENMPITTFERPAPVSIARPLSSAFATAASRGLLQQMVQRWNNRYVENQNNYKEGGYMPVNAGDVLRNRYMMMHKLGWGEFSTVWLAFDREATEVQHTFVAIKIAKCHASVTESSKYEVNLLKYLRCSTRRGSPITQLLDSFEHRGLYGNHLCMVMPVHGSNMLCIIDQMKAKKRRRSDKEMQMVKEITMSMLQGLVDLEAINVIHTDLKPENVLCSAPDPKILQLVQSFFARNKDLVDPEAQRAFEHGDPHNLVCLADFGLSALLEPASTHNEAARSVGRKKEFMSIKNGIVSNVNGTMIQTREYRAPEILFGTDFNCRSDVWSIGCMVYEMITGDFLVDPKRKTRVEKEMDVEHLAMIMQIIGPVPSRISQLVRSPNPPRYLANYFNENGQFIHAEKYRHYPRRSLAAELEVYLEPSEAERAAQFIMSCFTYDPMERCHASDLLRHSWLKASLSPQ